MTRVRSALVWSPERRLDRSAARRGHGAVHLLAVYPDRTPTTFRDFLPASLTRSRPIQLPLPASPGDWRGSQSALPASLAWSRPIQLALPARLSGLDGNQIRLAGKPRQTPPRFSRLAGKPASLPLDQFALPASFRGASTSCSPATRRCPRATAASWSGLHGRRHRRPLPMESDSGHAVALPARAGTTRSRAS
jgi:hypothetical protein